MKVEQFIDPYLQKSWQELGARVLSAGSQVSVTLGYPALGFREELAAKLKAYLNVDDVELELHFSAPAGRGFNQVKAGIGGF